MLAFERASLGQHFPGRPARVCGDRFQCVRSGCCSDVGEVPQLRLVHRTQSPLMRCAASPPASPDYIENVRLAAAPGGDGLCLARIGEGLAQRGHARDVDNCAVGLPIQTARHTRHRQASPMGFTRVQQLLVFARLCGPLVRNDSPGGDGSRALRWPACHRANGTDGLCTLGIPVRARPLIAQASL